MRKSLNYGRQSITDADIDAVAEVLRSDFLTTGPVVEQFEVAVAAATGARHAVACSSGTAALHIAAKAVGLSPGDVAIVPSLTFLATANAVRYVGANVVFADCDPETGLMRPEDLKGAIERADGRPVKAVLPVHYAGQLAHPAEIYAIADETGAVVVEDAAHALGSAFEIDGRLHAAGGHRCRTASIFSFHPVKTIATGEGGMVMTDDNEIAAIARRFRNHGIERSPEAFTQDDLARSSDGEINPWYYEMAEPGYNYRLSDIHAALGISQMSRLDAFIERRRQLVERYDSLIVGRDNRVRPLGRVPCQRPAWHLYVALIDFDAFGTDRASVMIALRSAGIGTQVHYVPIHLQPYYQERYGRVDLPNTQALYERILSLPLFPDMADADVDRVVDGLFAVLSGTDSSDGDRRTLRA